MYQDIPEIDIHWCHEIAVYIAQDLLIFPHAFVVWSLLYL